jgi:hypothetical protein
MKSIDDRRVGEPLIHTATEDSMGDDADLITQPKFRIWLRPDGIVQLVWNPRTTVLLEDATAALQAMAKLTRGQRSPLLVDMHDTGPLDRPTRAELTRRSDLQAAVALIVGTPLTRMMANFFLSVNRPAFPTRMFDDEASAVAWLLEFVGSQ